VLSGLAHSEKVAIDYASPSLPRTPASPSSRPTWAERHGDWSTLTELVGCGVLRVLGNGDQVIADAVGVSPNGCWSPSSLTTSSWWTRLTPCWDDEARAQDQGDCDQPWQVGRRPV
jgi:hypothetical protein